MIEKRLSTERAIPRGLCGRWLLMIMCLLLYVGTAQASAVVLTDAEAAVKLFSDYEAAPQTTGAIAAVDASDLRQSLLIEMDWSSAGAAFPAVSVWDLAADNAIRGPSYATAYKTSLITIIHRLH